MKFLSPAKVNLRLEVLEKRDDGYHDIFSIIQPIDLYDEVFLKIEEGSSGIRVDCDHPQVPSGRNNLAYLAAETYVKHTGFNGNIRIKIKKKIPVAAGLGGGSSNAATVLKGLNNMSGEKLPLKELQKMGRGLGADIPFFLLCKSAVAQGIGDILKEIEIPKFWYILINPGFPVSTKEVYEGQKMSLTKKEVGININDSGKYFKTPYLIKSLLCNDLEETVFSKYPEIRGIKKTLIERGAIGSLVSGSGATVFGLFQERCRAEEAYKLLMEDVDRKDWTLFLAQGI